MIIFNDASRPIIIDNLFSPLVSKHMWVLDLQMLDFTLTEIVQLESFQSPSLTVEIDGFQFNLPAHWHILVHDRETTQIDTVSVAELAGRNFNAFMSSPHRPVVKQAAIKVVDYNPCATHVNPSLNKHQMLCHAVNENWWITISPSDPYSKYLKNCSAGDLV